METTHTSEMHYLSFLHACLSLGNIYVEGNEVAEEVNSLAYQYDNYLKRERYEKISYNYFLKSQDKGEQQEAEILPLTERFDLWEEEKYS